MMKKKIKVTTMGIHGDREYIFHHGLIVVNDDTRGMFFAGQSEDTKNKNYRITKYIPFRLIMKVEIEDYDGGLVVCRSPEFISLALTVLEDIKPVLEVIE